MFGCGFVAALFRVVLAVLCCAARRPRTSNDAGVMLSSCSSVLPIDCTMLPAALVFFLSFIVHPPSFLSYTQRLPFVHLPPRSSQPPSHPAKAHPPSSPLRTPRQPLAPALLVNVHRIIPAIPATQIRSLLPRPLLIVSLHLDRTLLLPSQLLALHGIASDGLGLGLEVGQRGVAPLRPCLEGCLEGGQRTGGEVAQRGDGGDADERAGRVEGGGQQAGVDGGRDELFEGAGGGQVESGEEVGVGEGGVGVGEGEQREQEQLLVLLGGELGELRARCV